MVQYLRRFKENDRSVGVPLLTNPDAEIDGGHVGIEVRSNYETTPTAEGFERIDVKELPATLWNLAGSPVLFGYKYAVPPAPMKLALTRHEDLAVLVGNPLPEWPWPEEKCGPMEVRYIAGLYKLEEVGPLLRKQAAQVGMDEAECWLGLSDGGNGLEERIEENFPLVRAIILDFYHPAERLTKLSQLLHPQDEAKAEAQAQAWCQLLKEEGGALLAAVLREWTWPPGRPALADAVAETVGYLENHAHRMEYPEYLAEGWFIGSGAVESACKTVVGQRLKLAGMRWGEDGADQMCHLRALYRSEKGQWEAFWNREYTQN